MVLFNYMAFNLHRSMHRSDWGSLDSSEWNIWQKIAAHTFGIITPGNVVSCGGALLVAIGLIHLTNEVTLWGVLFVAIGRAADAVDGFVADKTGTKSMVGEAIDSTMDKLVAGAALITVYIHELLPAVVIALIAVHTIANSVIAIIGRLRRIEIHPSLYGKLATFLIWVTILMYLVYYVAEYKTETQPGADALLVVAWGLFVAFAVLATQSTVAYIKQLTP